MSNADADSDALINASLQRLDLVSSTGDATTPVDESETFRLASPASRARLRLHEGYGFRPASGASTPAVERVADSPLPDRNGLGWPGEFWFLTPFPIIHCETSYQISTLAKSTVSRLTATPEEKKAREEKLSGAVRIILECLGEDPDREGLLRTPERYAQALMWMTRGYEERLAGTLICSLFFIRIRAR